MIVKDESAVIEKCLDSVKPYIDFWVIADTGSSDNTVELIEKALAGIPGVLLRRPWIDFAHNRNEVLEASKNRSDYILFIDADEKLLYPFDKSQLKKDSYAIRLTGQSSEFTKMFLIKNNSGWYWKGILHERILNVAPTSYELMTNTAIEYNETSGRRSQDPEKFLKDAQILRQALAYEPSNTHYLFYLAQSYAHAKEYQLALATYEERALHEGSKDEVFWSLYCIGCLSEDLKLSPTKIIASYCKAYQFDPSRAEPLYRLAVYLQKTPHLSYLLAKWAAAIPFPKTAARSQAWIYEALPFSLAEYAYNCEKYEESYNLQKKLLLQEMPPDSRTMLEENLVKIRDHLSKNCTIGLPRYHPLSKEASRPLEQ